MDPKRGAVDDYSKKPEEIKDLVTAGFDPQFHINREKAAIDRDQFYKRNAAADAGRKPGITGALDNG
jgi:hypothetical protein